MFPKNHYLIIILFIFVIFVFVVDYFLYKNYQDQYQNKFFPTQSMTSNYSATFNKCEGVDSSEKEIVAYHRILLAKSEDGKNFTRLNQSISDRASVPDLMIDKDGNLRIYFIQVACKEQNLKNNPVLAISENQGENWQYKRLTIEAPKEAPTCKEPGGNPAPVDPEVILMPDNSYRLYATCPTSTVDVQHIPKTFVFTSSDGINFKNAAVTFTPKDGRALDPVVLKTDSVWQMFNGDEKGGTLFATSSDGITFIEKEQFCPFKFTNSKGTEKCYIVGDSLVLKNPTRYRLYLFGNTPEEGFKSIVSSDGIDWQMEQQKNAYILQVDNNSVLESKEIASPTIVQLKDGSYLMAYETLMPNSNLAR